jgi:beta-lactamase class A
MHVGERVGMSGVGRNLLAAATAAATVAVLTATAFSPALAVASKPGANHSAARAAAGICTSAKHARLAARISKNVTAQLARRPGSTVGMTVADESLGLTCSFHANEHFIAASVIKVTILSALLLKEGGRSHLTAAQQSLAWNMITESDDDAATALWDEVGIPSMQAFLTKAGMRHTVLSVAWGLTELTAHDEMTLLHVLTTPGKILSKNSRTYVLRLMASVIPSQRWGVSAGAPSNVTVHIKNGWLPYPDAKLSSSDWHINSIGAFTGKNIGYQIVVLTAPSSASDPEQTEGYGITTIQDAAGVVNRQLASADAHP